MFSHIFVQVILCNEGGCNDTVFIQLGRQVIKYNKGGCNVNILNQVYIQVISWNEGSCNDNKKIQAWNDKRFRILTLRRLTLKRKILMNIIRQIALINHIFI